MAAPALKPQYDTYQDVLDADPNKVAELIYGSLYLSPRPAWSHAVATSTLGMDIGSPFMRGRGGPGGWWILDEPELHFGEQILVPDLAGWRRERMPTKPTGPYQTLAPDWVCEVLSPSTARMDRVLKLPIYAEAGVKNIWLVDPINQVLEIYRLDGVGWRLIASHGGDSLIRGEPFEAIELELAAVWGNVPEYTPPEPESE